MSKPSSSKWHWLTVFTFDRMEDARQLEAFLLYYGFEVRLSDERRLQRFWLIVKPKGGIHLQIHTKSLEESLLQIKAQPGITTHLQKALRCPSCDSSWIHYPAMTRKKIFPALEAQVATMLGLATHEFYCEDCHNTWTPSIKQPAIPQPAK